MIEEKKSAYVGRIRQEFASLATGHGVTEAAVAEMSDFLENNIERSFRNGINFAKKRGFAGVEMREAVA